MNVAITGATGLVGTQLSDFLAAAGHQVVRVVRRDPQAGEVFWKPSAGEIDQAGLEGVQAVVHLAGENVGGGRWTAARKKRIRDSRVQGTELLCNALAQLASPPQVLVSASAIGYYGDRGDELLTEASQPGNDFLASVCQQWEAATQSASRAGIRVVNLRIGVIMSPRGGALPKMLTPFKLCLGGKVGSGRQYWSWIGIDDVVGAVHHAIVTESLAGPVNAVSQKPLTNLEFTKVLGRVLKRPTIFPMPAFAARLAFGEMADGLLLCSQKVQPSKLAESGYQFRHENLEDALRHLLAR